MENIIIIVAVVLIVLWATGVFAFHMSGGLIHLLLVIGLVLIVYRLLTGKKIL